ncbi:MAG: hypothetical protein A2283_00110 [Lentisphaerae bacterium RIFOXYA12_FULL_48_11]|nr:MAG: hypothetical protein A2283_00110 [Lentisphaerae bacterium RIFOXYA12_FULL_48_11]
MKTFELEESLDSFDQSERQKTLQTLAEQHRNALAPEGTNVNMHFHSFFSYNAEGYSPSHIAWESKKNGLYAAGLCDFDVLDGMEEFFHAGLLLSLRSTVNVETRAYLKEYASVDINSPGEPGVTYIMGAGFAKVFPPNSPQAKGQQGYRDRARARNIALINRINPHLPDIAIDYEKDVVPLTPSGAATERHIISAYINKIKSVFKTPDAVVKYLAGLLGRKTEETIELLTKMPSLEEIVRSKLAKRGGLGYEQPSISTFPSVEEFIKWVASCEAIPMITWLDGTSAGEKDGRAMLECMKTKGAVALNIIPDRNWNISDQKTKATKVANLKAIVEAADKMDLPINIGTEMNKLGLPFVDDLAGEVLKPYKETFLKGARIMVGHTLLLRYADYSYISAKAETDFKNVQAKNSFFADVGKMTPMTLHQAKTLQDMGPDKALSWFKNAVTEK